MNGCGCPDRLGSIVGLLHSTDTTLSGLFLIGVCPVDDDGAHGEMTRSCPDWLAGFTRMLVTEGREGAFCNGAGGSAARKPMSIHGMEKWKGGWGACTQE